MNKYRTGSVVLEKPFDATQIEEASEPQAHDSAGDWASAERTQGRQDPLRDLRRLAQGSKDAPEVVPEAPAEDAINPAHYRRHPSGIECIEITRHMNFNVGNAVKYLWRYMDKDDPIENLQKAQWYIDDEIRRLKGLR